MTAPTETVDHAFDGSFDGTAEGFSELVSAGRAIRVHTVLELDEPTPGADHQQPTVDVPDRTADSLRGMDTYGS